MVPLTFCSSAGGLPELFYPREERERMNELRDFLPCILPSDFFLFLFGKSAGQPHPRVHPRPDEDALLPVLPRTPRCAGLQQLLPQRHEGLPGQSGRPGHGVEPVHR